MLVDAAGGNDFEIEGPDGCTLPWPLRPGNRRRQDRLHDDFPLPLRPHGRLHQRFRQIRLARSGPQRHHHPGHQPRCRRLPAQRPAGSRHVMPHRQANRPRRLGQPCLLSVGERQRQASELLQLHRLDHPGQRHRARETGHRAHRPDSAEARRGGISQVHGARHRCRRRHLDRHGDQRQHHLRAIRSRLPRKPEHIRHQREHLLLRVHPQLRQVRLVRRRRHPVQRLHQIQLEGHRKADFQGGQQGGGYESQPPLHQQHQQHGPGLSA